LTPKSTGKQTVDVGFYLGPQKLLDKQFRTTVTEMSQTVEPA
jgi:hypothetical protein